MKGLRQCVVAVFTALLLSACGPTTRWDHTPREEHIVRSGETLFSVSRSFVLARSSSSPSPLDRVAIDALLRRVGNYVEDYEREFSAIVAEERYVQVVRPGPPRDVGKDALEWKPMPPKSTTRLGRRLLRSDVLLIRTPNDEWFGFRDVLELNGNATSNRERRLEKLFVSPSKDAIDQLRRVADESARYNIGEIGRNFNVPTTPLLFLNPSHQNRFVFEVVAEETVEEVKTKVLRYEETTRPTLIRTSAGRDVPARGRVWVDPASGRVVQTELVVRADEAAQGTIRVRYRLDPELELWVPSEMEELYLRPSAPFHRYLECRATYSNFRQFAVTTEEKISKEP